MPLLKKLINLGKSSKAVVIPATWLEYYDKQGIPTDLILMEINSVITLRIPQGEERLILVSEPSADPTS